MDWIELTIHTTTAGADIVSEALMAEGATGTMVEDRADIPDPDKPNGYWEIIDPNLIASMPEDVLVHAWFTPDSSFADRMQALRSRCDELHHMDLGLDLGTLEISTLNVRDEDWAEVWKKFYKPFKAGRSLVVKPTWEHYDPQPGDRIIEIDPGMAFGSGTHETTSMCLELLEDAMHGGESVIDVGTGSGILAIGAAMLGAKDVLAIDIDPVAVRVAKENIEHNHLSDRVRAVEGNLLASSDGVCDLCVANIIADVICMFAQPLVDHIVPGGLFICSGIIKEREQDVVNALTAADYTIAYEAKTAEEAAAYVERIAAEKPDLIKLMITGGVLDAEVIGEPGVLRMQPGDAAELFLDGRRFSAEIAEMTAEGVTARLTGELPSTEAKLRITLYQGLPKAEKMELIVQKAVELGAARVVPVAMSRCVVQLSAKDGAKKQERWQKIAREACKQSGRCQMMAVDAPIAFPALLTALKTHEAAIVPWEDARGYSLTAFHREHPEIRDLAIVIGPEGGMSSDEIARMKDCGCQSVTLGARILRTETAGLCALSALFCLYGELE